MDRFLYRDWVDEFKREVSDEMERMRRSPVVAPEPPPPAGRALAEDLARAWDKRVEPPPLAEESLTTLQTSTELDLSRQEVRVLKAELEKARATEGSAAFAAREQFETLLKDKAELEDALARSQREVRSLGRLKELKSSVDEELLSLRRRLAEIRADYEARLKVVAEHAGGLEKRNAALEADLKLEREARLHAEQAAEEHRRRLVEAQALRGELEALKSSFDVKLETAAEFLEAKIRSVQDQRAPE